MIGVSLSLLIGRKSGAIGKKSLIPTPLAGDEAAVAEGEDGRKEAGKEARRRRRKEKKGRRRKIQRNGGKEKIIRKHIPQSRTHLAVADASSKTNAR